MQFNGEADNQDLYSDARYWIGAEPTDTTSYPLSDFLRNANFALDRITSLILKADNKWEFDDTNQSDLPIGTTALISGQSDYSIAVTHLKILNLRIKDPQGNWISLSSTNRRDLSDAELTAVGTPSKYDKLGNSIFLYPQPNYSMAAGLEVQFQRPPSYFAIGDTTKFPGFASQFHRLISLYGALDYCSINDLDKRAAKIQAKITEMEGQLMEFYATRNPDEQPKISLRKEDYGESSSMGGFGSRNPDGF